MLSRKNRPAQPAVDDAQFLDRIVTTRDERYLSDEDVATLTGRKFKSLQIAQLSIMKIPFALNAIGHPIVPVSVIEGRLGQARREVTEIEQRITRALASSR